MRSGGGSTRLGLTAASALLSLVAACRGDADVATRSGTLGEGGASPGAAGAGGEAVGADPPAAGAAGGGSAGVGGYAGEDSAGSAGHSGSGGSVSTGAGGAGGGSGAASLYCGDGIRDALAEQCDPGPTGTSTLCSPTCTRLESTAWTAWHDANPTTLTDLRARHMGAGVHPVASGSGHHALVTESRTSPGRVFVTMTTTTGVPAGNFVTALSKPPAFNADPVVAALGGNQFVAAWTASPVGGDGDELGIALQTFGPETAGPVAFANAQTAFGQRRPDILATATGQIVVAWEDQADLDTGPDIHIRTFSSSLVGGAETILAGTADAETRVALAPFGSSYVAAWRASADGLEQIRVQKAGGPVVSLSQHVGADAEDAPTLVQLDGARVLVVYARDDEGASRLRAAIVDVELSTVIEQPVFPTPSGYDAESFPSLTVVGFGSPAMFLGFTAHKHLLDAAGDEAILQQIAVEDGALVLVGGPQPFPTDAVVSTDQRRIRLAAQYGTILSPLFVAWQDDTPPAMAGDPPRPDVGFTLLPYPFLTPPSE